MGVSYSLVIPQGLQVCKWYLLWGLKSISRTYFGLFGATGITEQLTETSGLQGLVEGSA